ncbi:FMN-binding protein [Terrabacter sp. NPDC080008]|uniref:FMN-binding protein n=1 Tax=Terrabacter sp. NPDC080008 TaxID=3155176 RepID=UPI0034506A1A
MRKATGVVVGLAGLVTVGASWASGLAPKHESVAGAHIVGAKGAGPVVAAPQPTGGSKAGSKGKASSGKTSAASAPPRSGTVDGGVVDTQYGSVQVQVTFKGKKITNVHALKLTDSSGTSVSISAGAAPILRQEALAQQSAQIDVVSGATYTSEAYQQSLQSAIDAAHLG